MHNGCLFVLIVHKQSLNVNSPLPSVPLLLSPAFLPVLNCNEVLMILNRTPPPCFAPCTPLNVSVNYCGPCVRHKNYNNNNNVNITPLGDHWNTAKGCFEPLSSCFTEIHHREWAAQSDTWENQADSSFFLWMLISKFLTILNNEVSLFKSNLCESKAQASDCFKYSISEHFASVWCHWQVEGLQGLLRHTALVVSTEDPSTCCTNFVCKGQPFRRNLAPVKGEGSWNGLFRRRLVEWLQWDPVQD